MTTKSLKTNIEFCEEGKSETRLLATKVKRSYKSYKYLDEYEDLLTLKLVPVSETFLNRLGVDLIKWAKGEGSSGPIKMNGFFFERGISKGTLYRWMEKHSSFKAQYDFAKLIIGDRREELAFYRKADAGIFLKSAAHYDPDWHDTEEWRSRLNKHEDEKPAACKIVLYDQGCDHCREERRLTKEGIAEAPGDLE